MTAVSAIQSNRLAVLAGRIGEAHRDCRDHAASAAQRAIEAGHLLIEAKAALSHGQWLPWLRDQVGLSERSAQGYMRLARIGLKPATVADLGLRAAPAATATRRVPVPKAGQVLIGKADENPQDEDSYLVFAWPVADRACLHAVRVWMPAGAGAPHDIIGTDKPFKREMLPEIMRVMQFPTAKAVFVIEHRDQVWFWDSLRRFAVAGCPGGDWNPWAWREGDEA